MLNHTYTSVKNANLVDCGKKQHIPSQPSPLLKENFLGEFRTELERKKVLANLGIATELSLEWGNIKGDIGSSKALTDELDARTKYISQISGFTQTVIEGIQYLETVVGGEEAGEEEQNNRLLALEEAKDALIKSLDDLSKYIKNTVDFNITELQTNLNTVSDKVDNITELIKVSAKPGNALKLITEEIATHIWDQTLNDNEGDYREASQDETATHIFDLSINSGEGGYREIISTDFTGLYIHDLSPEVSAATANIKELQDQVKDINGELDNFVTRDDLGGGDFNFVNDSDFTEYKTQTATTLENIQTELGNTVKTGEDGHVDTLYVNTISKNNNEESIKITDSFEVTSGIPLDVRFVVKSLEELHSLKPLVCYAGMGVIVSDQASLYILRQPANGIIDEEYIADKEGINWKCPEDLIIEVLTQEEYDAKVNSDSINPNMFYYIHEEVTEEPLRKDFSSDEAYAEALNKWLRVLQLKYMSAVWGQEIEQLVSDKATLGLVKSLEDEIKKIDNLIKKFSGGIDNVNLKDLNDLVLKNTSELNTLTMENGTIPTLQSDLSNLNDKITKEYVTKEELTTESPDNEYIFVKKSVFDTYKTNHEASIAKQVETETLKTNTINLDETSISVENSNLFFGEDLVALSKEVPVIEVIDNNIFKDLKDSEKQENTYYYVYDLEERYVPESEFTIYKQAQATSYATVNSNITTNTSSIGTLTNLTTTNKTNLVYAINEVHTYVSTLSEDFAALLAGEGIISSMQTAIDNLSKNVAATYVTIESITGEEPEVSYIFVKNSEFESYKKTLQETQSQSISTNQVNTTTINIENNVLTTTDDSLVFNNEPLALEKNIPNIVVMDSSLYNPEDAVDDVYYYLTGEDDRYVLVSELNAYASSQETTTNSLLTDIATQKKLIGEVSTLTTTNKASIVLSINELVSRIDTLTSELEKLKALQSTP